MLAGMSVGERDFQHLKGAGGRDFVSHLKGTEIYKIVHIQTLLELWTYNLKFSLNLTDW